jgi:paraquat-inducible protein B
VRNMTSTFILLLACLFVAACADDLEMTVLYDTPAGLQKGDPVRWNDQAIGQVEAVERTQSGRVGVKLKIGETYRQDVTDQCRFVPHTSPGAPHRSYIEMVRLGPDGAVLTDGAAVEGSSQLSLLFERGGRQVQEWARAFKDEVDRWQGEIERLPEKEWYNRLERQIDELAREMEKAGEETRRYLQREVLPELEEALRRFKERFQQRGRGEETAPLERKLEELKHEAEFGKRAQRATSSSVFHIENARF